MSLSQEHHIANISYISKFWCGLQGLGKSSMYCGDGINDLMALASADVGVAIGASDAAAAAVFSTKQKSIGGGATYASIQARVQCRTARSSCSMLLLFPLAWPIFGVHI